MRPFHYERAQTPDAAIVSATWQDAIPATSTDAPAQFLAGGTTLLDLMKLDVMRPQTVIDINAFERALLGHIEPGETGIRLGALVRMADAAEHPAIRRDYPDRKSTRLNSSHLGISYAVFCLKKKKRIR